MSDTRYPVLIIDDHKLFGTTLAMALRGEGLDARTLAVGAVPGFLARPSTLPAGLVVLDMDLSQDESGSGLTGVELVEPLRARRWKVLVLSGSGDLPMIAEAIAAGAIGALTKSRSFEVLLQTVVSAAHGSPVMSEVEHQRWLARWRRYQAEDRARRERLDRLTHREREVLELLAAGMRAAAIAQHFVVSMPTVRTQIRSILAKLEVGSQLEAVALQRQHPRPAGRRRPESDEPGA